jgi:deferrochelatase/peroxidase EfeB
LEGQERAIGRKKVSGAPLGASDEFDQLDLEAHRGGEAVIAADAHVRLSSPRKTTASASCAAATRSPKPPESGSGQLDAGLFFISFQRDPHRQFVPRCARPC